MSLAHINQVTHKSIVACDVSFTGYKTKYTMTAIVNHM